MSHTCINHATHPSESWHTCERVMSHTWKRHVTHMNESCHTYEWMACYSCLSHQILNISRTQWVMLPVWMSHVTHMNESCHTYEWVMSHVWMSRVTRMNESCHTYEWVACYFVWVIKIGWQRPIGCLKLQVIFRKKAINCRALLWKMTCKDKASYGSSPPCTVYLTNSMSHVTHMNEACHTYIWVMSHIWMGGLLFCQSH